MITANCCGHGQTKIMVMTMTMVMVGSWQQLQWWSWDDVHGNVMDKEVMVMVVAAMMVEQINFNTKNK